MHLEIRSPDGTHRRLELTGPTVVGRGDDCDLQLLEVKASRRHLRIAREPGEPWVLEDLDSSNGTFLGEGRVLRARLAHGDVVRVGDTLLVVDDPPPAGLVGGRLALRIVEPSPGGAPAEAVAEAPPEAAVPAALPTAVAAPRVRPLDLRTFGRALVFAVVGLLAVAAVQLTLGARAGRAVEETQARRRLEELLAKSDVDAQAFERLSSEWLAAFPRSPDRPALERHREAVRSRGAARAQARGRLESLMQRLGSLPEARARAELLDLARLLPDDPSLAEQVRLALVELDRRRSVAERVAAEQALEEAGRLTAAGLPGAAQRRLSAFRASRAHVEAGLLARLAQGEEQAAAAVRALASATLAAASAEADAGKRRAILQAAWPGLAGTAEQAAIADALRFAAQPRRAPGERPGPGTGPTVPESGEKLLAEAAEAERLFGARRWAQARSAFEALSARPEAPALLRAEWSRRLSDLERVQGLVDALAAAVAAGPAPVRRLPSGPVTVVAADAAGLRWKVGETATAKAWHELEADDLLPLLTPPAPERAQRLGLAVLAASLSRPEALLQALVPLYAAGPAGAEVDALVARLLEGRAEAPEGGYRLHQGALVDRAGYEQRLEQQRLTALEAEAQGTLARLEKEPALKKLERLREARAELDRRRQHALLAIFDEKHYPYPYARGQPPYTIVQAEIDRRVARVQELWDGDDQVKLSRSGTVGRLADEVGAAVRELEQKGRDVRALKAGLARIEPYLTGETIRLRDFWLDPGEKRLLDYNRWVVEVYNPAQTAVATEVERRQVEITNAYRALLGYTLAVAPGDAAYEAIDDANVARVLDAGQVVPGSVVALRSVRVDDRLVRSARGHSLDMGRRGYFDHFSPPDPATGAPRRSPFDRMRDAGYEGGGGSENIAAVDGSPQSAHEAWRHSSGHHRNLLSDWADLGSGVSGRLWTQNFGVGGGRPTVIEALPAPAKR